jgi:spermidine dehydrogenase
MPHEFDDRRLGMDREISRRDFLDGVAFTLGAGALATGGALFPSPAEAAAYPPAETGLRGQYDATYTVAHRLRDGTFWQDAPAPANTGERYDLAIVGAGISGLSAAYYYRRRFPDARILILDNTDDFGGHAKRSEFTVEGRELLSYSGAVWIERPAEYSAVALEMLHDLGIDLKNYEHLQDRSVYAGLGTGCFFGKRTFGRDAFVTGMYERPWDDFFANAPLSARARADLVRIHTESVDYLPGLTADQKRERLRKISYADYLTKIAGASPEVLPFFQTRTHDLWGIGIDAVSAYDVWDSGDDYGRLYPGFQGMDLGEGLGKWERPRPEPDNYHFPDGNATVARLLVRSLIPGIIPGHTPEDVILAPCDYSRLDRPSNGTRIRLRSTVARVRHLDAARHERGVEVAYVLDGKLHTVQAGACVLACWNVMVPYIAPELPRAQRAALATNVKVPLVYAHVALRNWQAFKDLGVFQVEAPNEYYNYVALDYPVDFGAYKFPRHPADPMVLFMLRTPCKPGLTEREQHRAGRRELFTTPFVTYERNVRGELLRILGSAGFDPARDIAGITINRWSHGYSYELNSLFDPDLPEGRRPYEIARKTYGRIAIANADSQWYAHNDAAIDQAHRAVGELLAGMPSRRG